MKGLTNCKIELCKARSPQRISSSSAKLTGRGQHKCTRIKPACRSVHSAAIWTKPRVGITHQVWSFRDRHRLQIRIVKGQHWSKRHVAVNAGNAGELPSAEPTSAPKRQLIHKVPDEIVPNVKSRTSSTSLAIENVLRRRRFINSFYEKTVRGVIY